MSSDESVLAELSAIQRDQLVAIAQSSQTPCDGFAIQTGIESIYGAISTGRHYPNLNTLVDNGFVTKQSQYFDARRHGYSLTSKGDRALRVLVDRYANVRASEVAHDE